MQKVILGKIQGDPVQLLDELQPVYEALREAASRANDLHAFLGAELSLASIQSARWGLERPQNYMGPVHYLKADTNDSAEELFRARCLFVHNAAMG